MAGTNGSLTATGSVTLALNGTDTRAVVGISGDYTTTTGVLEGSADGTNFFALPAIDRLTNLSATGTLSPANAATKCWEVNVLGLSKVRFRVTAIASNTIAVSITSSAQVGSATPVQTAQPTTYTVLAFPMVLANIANGDMVTSFTPGFAGRIVSTQFVTDVVASTASKLATLNLEIGTTDVTGGVLSLTTVACNTKGKVAAGTAITATNTFSATDTISVEATSVTAFVEGSGSLQIVIAQP